MTEPSIDPREQRRRDKERARELAQAQQDFRSLLHTPEGQRALRRLLQAAGGGLFPARAVEFDPAGRLDVNATIYRLGQADYPVAICRELFASDPTGYAAFMSEWQRDAAKTEIARQAELSRRAEAVDTAD